mmetsp:Transcript_5414/g.10639  ORF Transcript_5414/g.10639 Transcript_5414/m.10639 type:complete len:168 (-) Transcript_5414:255-758(-)
MKVQPYGKVPAWVGGDGLELYESRAIARYVVDGSELVPTTPHGRALMDQWISVSYSYFQPNFLPIYHMRVLKKAPLDEAREQSCRAELGKTLDIMEAHLSSRAYLLGETFTLADLDYACYLQVFGPCELQSSLDTRPALNAWSKRILGRPAWQYVLSLKFLEDHAAA